MTRNLILWVPFAAWMIGVASIYSYGITGDLMILVGWLMVLSAVVFGVLSSALLAMRGRAVALIPLGAWICLLALGGIHIPKALELAKTVSGQG